MRSRTGRECMVFGEIVWQDIERRCKVPLTGRPSIDVAKCKLRSETVLHCWFPS